MPTIAAVAAQRDSPAVRRAHAGTSSVSFSEPLTRAVLPAACPSAAWHALGSLPVGGRHVAHREDIVETHGAQGRQHPR